ncbi:E3 ubiquitin-protein ligase PDZRN3 [Biomphalaria glabrata]|nr:E3 ubiquitin-protein ligase PDZRN3 [Biomphalaria glabrata]
MNGEFAWRRVTLHRDQFGSLGFNIMGGYTPENNNNNGPAGVVISRVTEGGVGDVNGIRVSDRIIKREEAKQKIFLSFGPSPCLVAINSSRPHFLLSSFPVARQDFPLQNDSPNDL